MPDAPPNNPHTSLCELNRRFLELLAADEHEPACAGLSDDLRRCLLGMSLQQKKAVADCPYALFDLRFADDVHWRARLHQEAGWQVAEPPPVMPEWLNFVRLALFYAWHVAHAATLTARVQLGMSEAVVNGFRNMTLDRLPALAAVEAGSLSVKWSAYPAFWGLLTRAATGADAAALRRVQLYGLQLAAAARL